jgi:hypothetical protein
VTRPTLVLSRSGRRLTAFVTPLTGRAFLTAVCAGWALATTDDLSGVAVQPRGKRLETPSAWPWRRTAAPRGWFGCITYAGLPTTMVCLAIILTVTDSAQAAHFE